MIKTQDEEWFTINDIVESDDNDKLYCIAVDSPDHQFLAGKMGVPTHNTDEGKAEDELKGEAQMLIGSIARLGRAAGVHLVIATQRPDASLIPGETRDNLAVRLGCGVLKPNASSMLFGSNAGQRIRSNPKGGIYLQIHGQGNFGQGFYAPSDWLNKYYEAHPEEQQKANRILKQEKPADDEMAGVPQSEGKERTPSAFEDDWDEDMEAIESVADDNMGALDDSDTDANPDAEVDDDYTDDGVDSDDE